MSANFSTNIGDDYMQSMMEPGGHDEAAKIAKEMSEQSGGPTEKLKQCYQTLTDNERAKMMMDLATSPEIIDWSKPIELYETNGAVYQVSLVGFDGKDLAVVRKVNHGQYIAYRKYDGSLAGGTGHRYIRNKVGV